MAENGDGSLEVAHLDYESDESEGVQAEDHGKEDGIGSAEDDSMEVEASPSSGRAALVSRTVGEDQLDIDVQKCLTSIESVRMCPGNQYVLTPPLPASQRGQLWPLISLLPLKPLHIF